jgi:hypothetical protein
MKVTIYVDWYNNNIYSEIEAKEAVKKLADYGDEAFSEWLGDNYTAAEIFYMNDNTKEEVRADFIEFARKRAWEDFECDCEKKEIEI